MKISISFLNEASQTYKYNVTSAPIKFLRMFYFIFLLQVDLFRKSLSSKILPALASTNLGAESRSGGHANSSTDNSANCLFSNLKKKNLNYTWCFFSFFIIQLTSLHFVLCDEAESKQLRAWLKKQQHNNLDQGFPTWGAWSFHVVVFWVYLYGRTQMMFYGTEKLKGCEPLTLMVKHKLAKWGEELNLP